MDDFTRLMKGTIYEKVEEIENLHDYYLEEEEIDGKLYYTCRSFNESFPIGCEPEYLFNIITVARTNIVAHKKEKTMSEFTNKEYNELIEYVSLDGTEIGDYLLDLLYLWDVPESHGKRKTMQDAIDKELLHWLEWFKKVARIVEITGPQPDKIYKELEWL